MSERNRLGTTRLGWSGNPLTPNADPIEMLMLWAVPGQLVTAREVRLILAVWRDQRDRLARIEAALARWDQLAALAERFQVADQREVEGMEKLAAVIRDEAIADLLVLAGVRRTEPDAN